MVPGQSYTLVSKHPTKKAPKNTFWRVDQKIPRSAEEEALYNWVSHTFPHNWVALPLHWF